MNGKKRQNELIHTIHSAANDEIEPEIVCRIETNQQIVDGGRVKIIEAD